MALQNSIILLLMKELVLSLVIVFFSNILLGQGKLPVGDFQSESVYLQTSKSLFERGEDLWFSATILENQSLLPAVQSESLYVMLKRQADGELIYKETFEINRGFTQGHLFLPDTLSHGLYGTVCQSQLAGDQIGEGN